MAQFYADHEAIRRFGSAVSTHASAVDVASTYASRWVHVPDTADGQIFRNFIGAANDAEAAVADGLARLRSLLASAGRELDAAAAMYRDTDSATAAEMDARTAQVGHRPAASGSAQPR